MKIISTLAAAALVASLATTALSGSETPPEGPPWRRDLVEAQRVALETGKPIFCYFTKPQ